MIDSRFDEDERILYAISYGRVTLDEMLLQIEEYKSNDLLPRDLSILEDASNAKPVFSAAEFPLLIKKIEEALPMYNSIRHAVIHVDPVNTAYSLMFEKDIQFRNYQLKVFSTTEAAKSWLQVF
jgi:hypothetical protein